MQYAVANGTVTCASPDATLTTRPRAARSAGSAAAVTRHGPSRLMSSTASAFASGGVAGALRDPDARVVDQHVEPAEALDRLRDRARRPRPGRARRRRSRRRASSARRSSPTTRAPRARSAAHAAPPIPPDAPVTSTRALMPVPPRARPGGSGACDRAGSNRRLRRRKRQVQSGQIVALRPVASMYQLAQPVFQTVPSILASTLAVVRGLRLRRDLGDRGAAPAHHAQRVDHVVDLGLDHVDHRAVAQAGVGPEQHEQVREAGDRRAEVRLRAALPRVDQLARRRARAPSGRSACR